MDKLYVCGQCGTWSEKEMKECMICGSKQIEQEDPAENVELEMMMEVL